MTHIRLFYVSILVASIGTAQAQTPLGPEQIVQKALDASPAIRAQVSRHQATLQTAKSLGSGQNPELEIAPGIGFTNSNFVLGQTFDLSGKRSAQTRIAQAEAKEALAELQRTRLHVAELVLAAYADYLWSVEMEAFASQTVEAAQQILSGVAKRVGLGEAPAVQRTRAEVELLRAQQAQIEARAKLASNLAVLNQALGIPFKEQTSVQGWLTIGFKEGAETRAISVRPEVMLARARIDAARAGEDEAKSLGRPSLFAGVAADTWSLNRNPFRSENLGLQVSLKMPLIDRGENRFALKSAEFTRKAREEDLRTAERLVMLEVEQATIGMTAATQVASSYASGIVPKAEEMLSVMRQGYESGLVNFLEVLEAQQTLSSLRREAADATRALRFAEVRYLAAIGQFPGLENTQR